MTRFVLTADETLMTDFRDVPLATFFSCIPTDFWISRQVFRLLAPRPQTDGGFAIRAPYGIRKVEASLVKRFGRDAVAVVDPLHLDKFLNGNTEAVGIYTMDPLGLGPVSMSFTVGGTLTPYTKAKFYELMASIDRPGRKYKTIVGGPGAWQFDYREELREVLGIDHVVHGEADVRAADIFDMVVNDGAPPVMKIPNLQAPRLEEIPPILGATMHSMVEVMRGCGRGCAFCEVTLRRSRYFPLDFVRQEIGVNTAAGSWNIQLHSDDIFLYKAESLKTCMPNTDAIKELFRATMSVPGVRHAYPTHGTISAVCAEPDLPREIGEIVHAGPSKWVGIQCGLETGSRRLSREIMPHKAAPYQAEDWPDLILEGTEILNKAYWFPAYTLIMGLPGETPEDAWETYRLIDRMELIPGNRYITAPLTFVPIGVLRGEEFYNLDESIDESRFNVTYRCWKHILSEIDRDLGWISRLPPPMKQIVHATGILGGRFILSHMEKYAQKRGFRIRPKATTVREAEGHTISLPAS